MVFLFQNNLYKTNKIHEETEGNSMIGGQKKGVSNGNEGADMGKFI